MRLWSGQLTTPVLRPFDSKPHAALIDSKPVNGSVPEQCHLPLPHDPPDIYPNHCSNFEVQPESVQ